ncbi:VOC family protein [Myxococcota bacterium]|nr:VOC family protein [Myxococcota bacterium]
MRLRQVCLLSEELEETTETLVRLFDSEVCYRDPEVAVFGLVNALIPLGPDYLEVVSPSGDDCAGKRRLNREGPGGYMLIFQTTDACAVREHAVARGAEVVWQYDDRGIHATHFHPRSLPGAIVSVDSMEEDGRDSLGTGGRWDWAGPNWRHHRRDGENLGFACATIQSRDSSAIAGRWQELLGLAASQADLRRLQLDNGELVFEENDGAAASFSRFSVRHRQRDRVFERAVSMGLPIRDGYVQVAGIGIGLEPALEV